MRKKIITISVVVLICIVLYVLYTLFWKRTPESIFKGVFDISLNDFDYTVDTFEEEWVLSDGYLLLIIKFNKLTQANIDYLKSLNAKPLPISETDYLLIRQGSIPWRFKYANSGYYLFQAEKIVTRDIEGIKRELAMDLYIFIVDINRMEAVLYYRFL